MYKLNPGINICSNSEYHADTAYLSSSSLKLLLEDPAKFHNEKILGNKPPAPDSPALLEGSLFHSTLLEPDNIAAEYAFFAGLRKTGPEFDAFKVANAGKVLISAPQQARVAHWVRGARRNRTAMNLITGGHAELSVALELQGVQVKARADYINLDKSYILDLKTSAYPVDKDSFIMTCAQWDYILSAALYVQVFSAHYGKPFTFYFSATNKQEGETQVFKISERTLQKGSERVRLALDTYKQCKASGVWTKKDVSAVVQEDIIEI